MVQVQHRPSTRVYPQQRNCPQTHKNYDGKGPRKTPNTRLHAAHTEVCERLRMVGPWQQLAYFGQFWASRATMPVYDRLSNKTRDFTTAPHYQTAETTNVLLSCRTGPPGGVNCLGAFGVCWTIQPLHNFLTTVYCRLEDPGNT